MQEILFVLLPKLFSLVTAGLIIVITFLGWLFFKKTLHHTNIIESRWKFSLWTLGVNQVIFLFLYILLQIVTGGLIGFVASELAILNALAAFVTFFLSALLYPIGKKWVLKSSDRATGISKATATYVYTGFACMVAGMVIPVIFFFWNGGYEQIKYETNQYRKNYLFYP